MNAAAADAYVAADVSATDDRAPTPVVEAVIETAPQPVADTVAEPVVAAAPAEATDTATTEAVVEDKTDSVHIGGISINVGPHAAAVLEP